MNTDDVATGHVLLGLLARGERHGYDLKQEHDVRFPAARPLAFGQVYTALESLRKRGLVEPAGKEKAGAAERVLHRITEAGRTELDAWLGAVEPPAPFADNPLQVKVVLALLVGDRTGAEDYLLRQRAAHLDRMRAYTRATTDPTASVGAVLAADYAQTHLDADLRWINAARDRVSALDEEMHR